MNKAKKTNRSFFSTPLSPEFEKERKRIFNRAVIVGSLLCGILVPLFGLLDLVSKPHMFWLFSAVRLGVTVICLTVYFVSKTPFGGKYPYPLSVVVVLSVCGSIALMCHLDQGPVDPYYAGINLPLVGYGIMFPATFLEAVFLFTLVWLSYFVPNLFLLKPLEWELFVSNNFFLISTIIIATAGTQFNLQHRINQWNAHRRLRLAHRKIKNHANELEEKVKERTQRLLQSERLAVVGQLAGGVAHDFNNILTAIMGIGELLLNSLSEDDPIRHDVEGICRVGRRAADLVKQLLAFSRRQILTPKVLNLNEVIRDVGKMLRRLIGEDIELSINTFPNLGNVMADPVQMEQIILNVSVNARDAMPKGGKLSIETANVTLDKVDCKNTPISIPPGEYVMMAFSDTGTGMSKEVKTKIFEPFFTTKEMGRGTGLGLSTVYGIVKQSNGDILVDSEKGKGATITVYLPRVEESEKTPDKPTKTLSSLPKGKETILLVEDEDDVRTFTARALEEQGYKVLQAREGQVALDIVEQYDGNIDLLVTDIVMPRMDGKTLAERLRAQRSTMKVLLISGYTEKMMDHQGVIDYRIPFLQKPFTMEALMQAVEKALGE